MKISGKERLMQPWWLLFWTLVLLGSPGPSASAEPRSLPGSVGVVGQPLPPLPVDTKSSAISPPPSPEDLAESVGVALGEDIRALAGDLGNQALAIHRWVRDEIAFIPTAGLQQGASGTLSRGMGNAADTASLLIALLRSADIPARFVSGSVRVPAGELRNWLGVSTTDQALTLLSQGGIAHRTEQAGGQVVAVEMAHVWVEAWVDLFPGRGSAPGEGDGWVALDPSAKSLMHDPGSLDISHAQAPADTLAADLLAQTEYDEAAGWRGPLPGEPLDASLVAILDPLQDNYALSARALLGDSWIIPEPRPVLPLGLPFPPLSRAHLGAALSAADVHRVELSLALAGTGIQTLSLDLHELLNHPLWLNFTPADQAIGQEISQTLLADAPLPGYRLPLRLNLWHGEQKLLEMDAGTLGETITLGLRQFHDGRTSLHQDISLRVGEHRLLAWQLVPAKLDQWGEILSTLESPGVDIPAVFMGAARALAIARQRLADWQIGAAGGRSFPGVQVLALGPRLLVDGPDGLVREVVPGGLALTLLGQDLQAVATDGLGPRLRWQLGQGSSQLAADSLALLMDGERLSLPRLLVSNPEDEPVQWLEAGTLEQLPPELLEAPVLYERLSQAVGASWQGSISPFTSVSHWQGWGVSLHQPVTGVSASWMEGPTEEPATALLLGDDPGWLLAGLGLAGDGINPLDEAAQAVAAAIRDLLAPLSSPEGEQLTDPLAQWLAASVVDLHTAPQLPAILADGLWQALMGEGPTLAALRDPQAPVVELTVSATTLAVGETLEIQASAHDNQGVASLAVSVDDQLLTPDTNHWQWTPARAGVYIIILEARDGAGNVGYEQIAINVTAPLDDQAPLLALPALEESITAPVPLEIQVEDANLLEWQLRLIPRDSGEITLLASGDQSVNGEVAVFDPTLRPNGLYALELQARDANGLESLQTTVFAVEGDLKLGEFSFSVVDLTVPMIGLPIQVGRGYDSRRREQSLGFGQGWRELGQAVRVAESRTPGVGWQLAEYSGGPLGAVTRYCVEPLDRLQVAVTLPDDRLARFAVGVSPACQDLTPALDVNLVFTPLGDTDSSLALEEELPLRYQNGGLVDLGSGSAADPDRYVLTTREGYVYQLDQLSGIREIGDPNGNTLHFAQDGIHHSDGRSVHFQRDAGGRITTVTDPLDRQYRYGYDAAGNLVAVADPLGAETRYEYDDDHRLLAIIDPDGQRRLQNRYDDQGRLATQTGPVGDATQFSHDLPGRETRIVDALGREWRHRYDDRGLVLSTTDPLGGTVQYGYDEHGYLASVVDPAGNTTQYTHNADGDVLSVTDPLGDSTHYQYDPQGRLLALVDARGHRLEIQRDARGNPVVFTDAEGNSASQTLDQRGRLLARTDFLGNTHRYEYNTTGDLVAEVDALGNRTEYELDALGNLLARTHHRTVDGETRPETTRYQLDALDRVVAVVDPLGNQRRYEFDARGEDSAYISPLGQRTSFETDGYGQLTRTVFPDGLEQRRSYDLAGNLLRVTDRGGRVHRYEYDALDRLIAETAPDGGVTRYEYDLAGNRVAVIDPLGNRHEFAHDAAGQVILERDPSGVEVRIAYDAAGNPVRITDADGNSVVHHYDSGDRLLRTTYPDGAEMGLVYDANGRLITRQDPGGQAFHFEYDALSRLIATIDALGHRTEHHYDEAGNRIAQIDANDNTTHWRHDPRGRLLSRTLPGGQQERFEYDEGGNLLRHHTFGGETISFSRNRMDWLVGLSDGVESAVIEYDARGLRERVVDHRGITRYQYDAGERVTEVFQPGGERVSYRYDLAGRRSALGFTPADGVTRWQGYDYDSAGRLVSLTDWQGEITRFGYDGLGNRQEIIYPNGVRTVFSHDSRNQPVRVETWRDGALLSALDYQLAPSGHRELIEESDGWRTEYRYDDVYRLVEAEASGPDGSVYLERYRYDAVGNRIEAEQDGVVTAYRYDANDRLLQAGDEHYSYDSAGNLTRRESAGEVVSYRYDPWRRLRRVETFSAGNLVGEAEFDYDLAGLRTAARVNGQSRRFILDSARPHAQLLAELDQEGAVESAFVGADGILARRTDTAVRYLHADALGSTRMLSDADGEVVTQYRYDAFGNPLSGDTAENSFLFAGEQWDDDLGLYYLRARYYDPGSGRFTGIDPLDGVLNRPLSQHKYLYALNDPANTVDPSGMFGLVEFNTANDIRAELSERQADAGVGLLDSVFANNQSAIGSAQTGAMVLVAMAGQNAMQLRNLFSRRARTSCGLKKNSFPSGTLVSTVDGAVPIEEIAIGDRVLAYDVDEDRADYREVLHLIHNEAEYDLVVLTLDDGEILEATDGHPVYVDGRGWVDAVDVEVGDVLRAADGSAVRVAEIGISTRRAKVFNLSVDQDHTFFVGERGVLVHNAKCKATRRKRNPNVVVIGRIMETRVKPYAKFFGFSWYAPVPPVDPNDTEPVLPTVEQNRRWIRKQMNRQRTVYDIGEGPATKESEHYDMEVWELTHYRHRQYKKELVRSGYRYPKYYPVKFLGLFCEHSWKRQRRDGAKYTSDYLCR